MLQVLLAKLQENDMTLEAFPETNNLQGETPSGVSDSGFGDSIGVNSFEKHLKAKSKKFSSSFSQVLDMYLFN